MNIEEFFRSGWYSVKVTKTALTALTVTVDEAAQTLTRSAGSWITDGIAVGDLITTTGFEAGGNNDTFEVTAVTATVLTVDDTGDVLVDVTEDAGVGVDPLTKNVYVGRCLLGRVRVLTDTITVKVQDNITEKWGTIIDDAEIDFGNTPIKIFTALKITFSGDGIAWIAYKVVD